MNSPASHSAGQLHVVAYAPADAQRWDQFIVGCSNATFLHSRRFLSYHKQRFIDASLLLEDKAGTLQAVFPAAQSPQDSTLCVSHPGATFGGLLVPRKRCAEELALLWSALLEALRGQGFRGLDYRSVPAMYHQSPMADDIYLLLRDGARVSKHGLSTTIDLQAPHTPSKRRQRGRRKAELRGVSTTIEPPCPESALTELWPVLERCLAHQHAVKPVHTLPEIQELTRRFPQQIRVQRADYEGSLVAGLVCFDHPTLRHTQYICTSDAGRRIHALDLLLEHSIADARERGLRYFDFGISTEDDGRTLNAGLDRFKREFGGGSTLYTGFTLKL